MRKIIETLFFRRPRILNGLHILHLAGATSQTTELELEALSRYARGSQSAIEIGSYQGVSAAKIAAAVAPGGTLFCVDPWPDVSKGGDPNFKIFERNLHRSKLSGGVKAIRGFSKDVGKELPAQIDFAFIDGDHSWNGIETDWELIAPRVRLGGVICLHDTAPLNQSWRDFESIRFFDERIAKDRRFMLVETVYSMRIVRRVAERIESLC